jgi:mono/diheme cytochrome c family protein
MPAWQFRMSDADIWAIVAFVRRLPTLSPSDYRAMQAAKPGAHSEPSSAGGPQPRRGKTALQQYGCVTCHTVPGVVGPLAHVGPPLDGIGSRKYIAGMLPNTTANMVRWIREPQKLDRNTAMPDLGVTERDARDIAAYLGSLE